MLTDNYLLSLFYTKLSTISLTSSTDLLPITSVTRGHNQRFHHIFARTSQYSNSFFPRLWNSLPPHLIQQQSLTAFKNQLKLLFPHTVNVFMTKHVAGKYENDLPIVKNVMSCIQYTLWSWRLS